MTHCQSHQNICDVLDVFGIEIGEVVVKPGDQSRGAELKQGSRGRQKRKDPRRRGATAIIPRRVGRQNCLEERAVFCFTKGELHRWHPAVFDELMRLFVIQSALTSWWSAPLCSSERQR